MGNDHYGSLSSSLTNELCNVNSVNSDTEDQAPLLRHSRSSTFTRTLSNGSNKSLTDSNLKGKCPTCQGKGRLSQSEWLAPFHFVNPGKCYLGITLLLSMLTIFLVLFFLLPRSFSLSIIDTKPVLISIVKAPTPFIDMTITYSVKNDNYFKAKVVQLNTIISWNELLLNTSLTDTNFAVSARTRINHTVSLRQIFSGQAASKRVQYICGTGWNFVLLEKFETTASFKYLGRSEQISTTYYGYTLCHNASLGTG